MSRKANPFKIGLFVIAAFALGVAAVVWLGAGVVLKDTIPMETYFDESVEGVEIGSPVKYRGVQIGNIKEIDFVREVYRDQLDPVHRIDHGRYVYIRASIQPGVFAPEGGGEWRDLLAVAIEKGLRVRIATQGLTGIAYLEVDYMDPQRFPPLEKSWVPYDVYVPSATSTITRFTEFLDELIAQLQDVDLAAIGRGVQTLVETVDEAVRQADLPHVARNLGQVVEEIRAGIEAAQLEQVGRDMSRFLGTLDQTVRDADVRGLREQVGALVQGLQETNARLGSVLDEVDRTMDELEGTSAQLGGAAKGLARLLRGQQNDVDATLENLRRSTAGLRALATDAQQYPANLLFSEAPPRIEPGKE